MEYFDTNEKVFRAVVFSSKILITVLVGILALINQKIDYIIKNPSYLIQDSLMLSTSTILAAIFIELSRIGTVKISHMVEIFFLFFTFSVLREFGGYFNFIENRELNKQQEKEKKPLQIVVFIVFGILALIGLLIAIIVHSIPTQSMFAVYKNSSSPNKSVLLWFLFETIIFTILTASAECFISLRHFHFTTDEKIKLIIENIIIFAGFHVVFQLAGIYSLLK